MDNRTVDTFGTHYPQCNERCKDGAHFLGGDMSLKHRDNTFPHSSPVDRTEATLAEKLRSWGKAASPHGTEWAVTNVTEFSAVLLEAADHIDTLTAENKRLSDLCDKHAGKNLLR